MGVTPVSSEQETEAVICTCAPKLDNARLFSGDWSEMAALWALGRVIQDYTGFAIQRECPFFCPASITFWFHRRRGRWDISRRCLRRPRVLNTGSGHRRSFPARCTSARPRRRTTTCPWSSCSCRRCSRRGTCTLRSDIRHDLIGEKPKRRENVKSCVSVCKCWAEACDDCNPSSSTCSRCKFLFIMNSTNVGLYERGRGRASQSRRRTSLQWLLHD